RQPIFCYPRRDRLAERQTHRVRPGSTRPGNSRCNSARRRASLGHDYRTITAVRACDPRSSPLPLCSQLRITAPSVQMDRFIDTEVEQFARDHTEPENDLYTRLREETYRTMKSPEMQVDLIEGRFLKMLVRLTGARVVLELGMFTGYSALMMAGGLAKGALLITCEIDPKAEAIARRYFAESARVNKTTIRMGPALETIKTLTAP